MNVEKSKLKMLIAMNMGKELEELRDKAERNIYRHQGAAAAITKAEGKLNDVTQRVRDELVKSDEEGAEPLFDPRNPIEVGKYIINKLMLAAKELHELGNGEATSAMRAEGIKLGYEQSVKTVFKTYEEEKNKLENLAKMIADGTLVEEDGVVLMKDADPRAPRPPGVHPGPPQTLKGQRQAEAASKGNGKTAPAKPVKKAKSKKKAAPKKAKTSRKKADGSNP